MKINKKVIIALAFNVILISSYFLYNAHLYNSNIENIERLGGKIGYGFSEVMSVNFAETIITNDNLNILKYNKNLRKLDLSRTKVSKLSSLYHMKKLDELIVSESNVSTEEINKILKELPSLKVINSPIDRPERFKK